MIVVYQMGKVGSTSICEALNKRGLETHQTHFLDFKTFHDAIDRFRSPFLTPPECHHISEQLKQNLLLRQDINRRRHAGETIQIITLVREPFSWYLSNLVQNLFAMEQPLRRWLREVHNRENDTLDKADFRLFFEELAQRQAGVIATGDDDLLAACRAGFKSAARNPAQFFYSEVTKLLRPHLWLDTHFHPLTEIDLYDHPFDAQGQRMRVTEQGFDILLLKFEGLAENAASIGNFCDLDDFVLVRENISRGKPAEQAVSDAIAELPEQAARLAAYTGSRYYQKFYADASTPQLAQATAGAMREPDANGRPA